MVIAHDSADSGVAQIVNSLVAERREDPTSWAEFSGLYIRSPHWQRWQFLGSLRKHTFRKDEGCLLPAALPLPQFQCEVCGVTN